MSAFAQLGLDDMTSSSAVLRLYRQAFAVLAAQAEAMVLDPSSLDVDEAIPDAFAEAGIDGLTVEQLGVECHHLPAQQVERRFQVSRDFGAISRAFRASQRAPVSGRLRAVRDDAVPPPAVGPGRAV